jgi:5'-3' exonuclease
MRAGLRALRAQRGAQTPSSFSTSSHRIIRRSPLSATARHAAVLPLPLRLHGANTLQRRTAVSLFRSGENAGSATPKKTTSSKNISHLPSSPAAHVVLIDGTFLAFRGYFSHPQLAARVTLQESDIAAVLESRKRSKPQEGVSESVSGKNGTPGELDVGGLEVGAERDTPTGALFGYTKALVKFLTEEPVLASPHVIAGGAAAAVSASSESGANGNKDTESAEGSARQVGSYGIDYFGVMHDSRPPPGKVSFRKGLDSQYKATRPPLDPALGEQLVRLPEVCESLGLFNMSPADGQWEADDLIATYATLASQQGCRVTIVTADKDMYQLISDGRLPAGRRKGSVGPIRIFNPATGKVVTPADVEEKFGVPPHLIPDLQSLIGDRSDNIPRVNGLGPKTSAKLVVEYGGVGAILKGAADNSSPVDKRVTKVREQAAVVKRNLQLVRLRTGLSVPPLSELQLTSDHARVYGVQSSESLQESSDTTFEQRCFDFLQKFSFNSVLTKLRRLKKRSDMQAVRDVRNSTDPAPETEARPLTTEEICELAPENTIIVRDVEEAKRVVEMLQATEGDDLYHAVDTECIHALAKNERFVVLMPSPNDSLTLLSFFFPFGSSVVGHGRIICFSIYCGPEIGKIWVDTLLDDDASIKDPDAIKKLPGQEIMEVFRPYLENPNIKKVYHNYSFDKHMFENHGITPRGFAADTLLMARLWDWYLDSSPFVFPRHFVLYVPVDRHCFALFCLAFLISRPARG